ncbi:MAG: SCO family protein [Balneolaceae bacterium]|nr:SCO family protein [Balneolaceae bacterium]
MKRFALCAISMLTVLFSVLEVKAQLNRQTPQELEGTDVIEHLGEQIPLDAVFATSNGDSVRIGDLLEEGKPVILNPLYYECPMLCGLVIDGVIKVVDELKWKTGEDFIVISFSIDPKEDHRLAATSKKDHLATMNDPSAGDGWYFLTGKQSQIDNMIEAVGFQYNEIEDTGEFAHSAAIMMLSPEGIITRYLYGIEYDEFNVRSALYESADGKIGNTLTKVVMYCYQYDPDSNSYAPVAINIMRLGGLATLIILGIFLGLFWLREKRKKSNSKTEFN